jgi:hypothetical protein
MQLIMLWRTRLSKSHFVTSDSCFSGLRRLQFVVQRVVQDVVHLMVHPVVEQPTDLASRSKLTASGWLSRRTVSESDSTTSIFPSLSKDWLAEEKANSWACENDAASRMVSTILNRDFMGVGNG